MAINGIILELLASIGRTVLGLCATAGSLAIFTAQALSHCVRPPFFASEIGRQFLKIGYFSLPVVGLTAVFTGAVLALQIYVGSARFNAESAVASIVAIGIVRELGPVLGGLMVAGRVSAAIAAEIGTMRVTEQIDALTTLSTNPFKYLVAPRLIAADGLLSGLPLGPRRSGRWPGDHKCGRGRLGADPGRQLCAHRTLLFGMRRA